MSIGEWIRIRSIELGAALCTAAILIGGLAAGFPYLQDRVPEVFFYSFCCVAAVVLRSAIDLAVRATVLAARSAYRPAARRLEGRPLGELPLPA